MTDLTTRLALLAEEQAPRSCSDDYKSSENAIAPGRRYNIMIGDVSFSFNFGRHGLSSISLWCDQVYMASFSIKTQAVDWQHHSTPLETHLNVAAEQLLERMAKLKEKEKLRKAEEEREKTSHQKTVLERFGIE
jgi:hypothetical protein